MNQLASSPGRYSAAMDSTPTSPRTSSVPWVPHITSDFSFTPFYSAPNNRTENSELHLTSHIATGPPQPHSILTDYDHKGSVMELTLGLMGAV